jgi:hypothetical protein
LSEFSIGFKPIINEDGEESPNIPTSFGGFQLQIDFPMDMGSKMILVNIKSEHGCLTIEYKIFLMSMTYSASGERCAGLRANCTQWFCPSVELSQAFEKWLPVTIASLSTRHASFDYVH